MATAVSCSQADTALAAFRFIGVRSIAWGNKECAARTAIGSDAPLAIAHDGDSLGTRLTEKEIKGGQASTKETGQSVFECDVTASHWCMAGRAIHLAFVTRCA